MKSFEEHIENLKEEYTNIFRLLYRGGFEPSFQQESTNYKIALMIYEMLKFELEDKELLLNMEKELRGKNEKNL